MTLGSVMGTSSTKHERVDSRVREARHAAGLTQEELARQCHVSRQALIAIEAGRVEPSVATALRLAAALGRPVEELFALADLDDTIEAELAQPMPPRTGASRTRVALAHLKDRWVAHPLRQDDPLALMRAADGVLAVRGRGRARRGHVELLRPLSEITRNLFLVGCDPALGLLADRLGSRGVHVTWMHAPSRIALDMLAREHTHVAGAHLFDERSGEFNVPFVRRMAAPGHMLVITLAVWELGLLMRPGHDAYVRDIAHVLDNPARARFVQREPGSEARALVERLLRQSSAPDDALAGAPVVHGHFAVAQAIAMGAADVGVATCAAAMAYNLRFLPLAEERFDLVMPHSLAGDSRIVQLIETLKGRAFRRELGCLDGYQTARSGDAVTIEEAAYATT